jgi:hypothetical protein
MGALQEGSFNFFPLERWKRDKGLLRDPEWNNFFSFTKIRPTFSKALLR